MNSKGKEEKHYNFEGSKEELRNKGFYECSNPELWNDLYESMKPEMPTLYKYEYNGWQYLIIQKKENPDAIVAMIMRKQKLQKEVDEINNILAHLGINPEEF